MFMIYLAFIGCSYGIPLGGRNWKDLGYADDLGILAKTLEELKAMMKKLKEKAKECGLNINFSKTKIMFLGPLAKTNTTEKVDLDGDEVEVVTTFEYLGRKLNNSADDASEVHC